MRFIYLMFGLMLLAGCEADIDTDQEVLVLKEQVRQLIETQAYQAGVVDKLSKQVMNLSDELACAKKQLDDATDSVNSLISAYEQTEDCEPAPAPAPKKTSKSKTSNTSINFPSTLQSQVKSDKLNVVIFKQDWCPVCRRTLQAISEIPNDSYNFIIVDTQKHPEMSKFMTGKGIPEIQVYSGKLIYQDKMIGFPSNPGSKNEFLSWLTKFKA